MDDEGTGMCRMYKNKYPEIDDLVVVKVKQIEEMGAYVELLEYNNIEGMILMSELSRRRIRSISKLIRVGRQETVLVLRVDQEKGYIDLSKRRVSSEEVAKTEEKFNKAKQVHSIMRHVAEKTNQKMEKLYDDFGWDLYKKYGHAFEAFQMALSDESVFDGANIPQDIKEVLLKNIDQRMTPQALKFRADIEVSCFNFEGVDAVKAALLAGSECEVDCKPKIQLVASPLYVLTCSSLDRKKGIESLSKAVAVIEKEITARGGSLKVKEAARIISNEKEADQIFKIDENPEGNEEDDDDFQEEMQGNEELDKLADEARAQRETKDN